MSAPAEGVSAPAEAKHLNVRQAAFIGVVSMVGAGIFALLGAAGAVAGAAVWLSFLIAGGVAILQGYSFAKLGARYPSAGGLLELGQGLRQAVEREDYERAAQLRDLIRQKEASDELGRPDPIHG